MKTNLSFEPIAIVGMSCRFPGINGINDFWNFLVEGNTNVGEIAKDRFDIEKWYDADKSALGKTNQNKGAFFDQIHKFDPFFFNISPKEAQEMHPSQKLMLELAWECIEYSNMPYNAVEGSKSGVYLGNIWGDFEHFRKEKEAEINSFSAIGQSANIIASRISYFMGLRGPSFVLDTGCSSSMVALNQAIESLHEGTIDMCFAGGINHILNPEQFVYLAKFGGLSSVGQCSSFDANADGFVRAEGAGLVLLKRLSDAVRDGNKIFAVIKGASINNNGFNENLPATSVKGQLELLNDAYKKSGIDPKKVSFVEAHGTGTVIGDPIEAKALGHFFAGEDRKTDPLRVGSVKSQLGHTEGAAGIAGFLKVVQSLYNKQLPGNLHFKTPNPSVDFDNLGVKVQTKTEPWENKNNEPLLAGVSSFGWGGTNVHIVLEEYKEGVSQEFPEKDFLVLPISAKSESALEEYVDRYISKIENVKTNAELAHICAASGINKPHFNYRIAATGSNSKVLVNQLKEIKESLKDQELEGANQAGKKVAFIFPGQGSQWIGMGKVLYSKEQAFKDAIDECDVTFSKYLDGSVVKELHADESTSNLKKIEIIQPMICAVQIALAKLWQSWGVEPDGVAGHSMGEVAAAYIAGNINLDEAARIICTRSKLMSRVSNQGGAMAVTELTAEEARSYEEKYKGKINLAVSNSPKSTVMAGDEKIILELLSELESKNLFCRQVKVSVASHSPQMDSIKDELGQLLQGEVSPNLPLIDFYSTVRGQKLEDEFTNAEYWVDNLRNSVQFSTVMEQMMEQGYGIFIEVSPHPVLTMAMNDCAEAVGNEIATLHSIHREMPEYEEYVSNYVRAYKYGCNINWYNYYNVCAVPFIELPSYPFQRENYEISDNRIEGVSSNNSTSLLGGRVEIAGESKVIFETILDIKKFPYLQEHMVDNKAVLPASAYLDMVYSALESQNKSMLNHTVDIQFAQPIVIEENKPVKAQIIIEPENSAFPFTIYSQIIGDKIWEIACHGIYSKKLINEKHTKSIVEKDYNNTMSLYEKLALVGVNYGETFRNVKILEIKNNTILAKVELDKTVQGLKEYTLHPVLADNFIQPLFASYLEKKEFSTQHIATVSAIVGINCFKVIEPGSYFVEYQMMVNSTENNKTDLSGRFKVYNTFGEVVLTTELVNGLIIDTCEPIVQNENAEQQDGDVIEEIMSMPSVKARVENIEKIVVEHLAQVIKSDVSRIKSNMTFKMLGLDSIMAVQLRNKLEKKLKTKIAVSSFWKEPNISCFAKSLEAILSAGLADCNDQRQESPEGKWFVTQKNIEKPAFRLFMFHDAGGSTMLFNEWQDRVSEDVELVSIQLPGRGERGEESAYTDYQKLMDELLPLIEKKTDIPFGFLGHSMGGLLAYESARQLASKYNKHSDIVVVSATPCLKGYVNHFVNGLVASGMSEEVLTKHIPALSKIKQGDADFYNKYLDTVRADFRLIHSYVYTPGNPLQARIVAICGEEDERVKLDELKGWEKASTGEVQIISRPGGHDYIYYDQEFYASMINTEISQLQLI